MKNTILKLLVIFSTAILMFCLSIYDIENYKGFIIWAIIFVLSASYLTLFTIANKEKIHGGRKNI